jgi:hypothetical protein
MSRLGALLLACALALFAADAPAAKVSLGAEVAAQTWKALRLRNLPKGASLAVRVESSGPIVVALVHEDEVKRFPNPVRPAFAGSLERRLAFRVTVPVAGTYYVILDNRKGGETRKVRLLIEALRPQPQKAPPGRPGTDGLKPI